MRCSPSFPFMVLVVLASVAFAAAQSQPTAAYSNVGRTPTPEEIKPCDIAISLNGKAPETGAWIKSRPSAGQRRFHGRNASMDATAT